MKRFLLYGVLIGSCFRIGLLPVYAEADEVLYKTCFPKQEAAFQAEEDCADEDCGLTIVPLNEPAPRVVKAQRYRLLGATDHGVIWGATTVRIIGKERVRFLLYVESSASNSIMHKKGGYELVPTGVIETAFFSSFGEYQGSAVSVSYEVKTHVERQEDIRSPRGTLEMVDLHCTAKKLKIYDNHTIYYRTVPGSPADEGCVELLWEKPRKPLRWQPVSSLMMDLLVGNYCGVVRN